MLIRSTFPLGAVVATRAVLEAVSVTDIGAALVRHAARDWGDLDAEDIAANDRALEEGTRLLSAYAAGDGTRFWIITEWDRSTTTVLLLSDY